MDAAATALRNILKLPRAASKTLTNLSKLQTYHQLIQDRRDRYAPLANHTYDQMKAKTTWHPYAHAWVDEQLPMSKKEFNEYCWLKRDMQKLLPTVCPLVFGVAGFLPLGVWLSNSGYLPSSFSDKKDIVGLKLEWFTAYGDDIRQQAGAILQYRLKRVLRATANQEHIFLSERVTESYLETFYSHHDLDQRDVRKTLHLCDGHDQPAFALYLTNKEPVEATEELNSAFHQIRSSGLSPDEERRALNQALIKAYKQQELRGGLSIKGRSGFEIPGDPILFGENAKGDVCTHPIESHAIPLEELEWSGAIVFAPAEDRTGMEYWGREVHKLAAQFLGLPWRFVSIAWHQRRLVSWFEEILQEDSLIRREGGIQKLSDDELKVVLLDRAVMRCDEDLTRGDMEARYKEVSWLMAHRKPFPTLCWATGYHRTTYSPEDDLPLPSILPKYNRTILDVDTYNVRLPDEAGKPRPSLHPALFPRGVENLAHEAALLAK